MFPIWLYFIVAAAIAVAAFAIGQVFDGAGVALAALASTLWTGYAVSRQRRSWSR